MAAAVLFALLARRKPPPLRIAAVLPLTGRDAAIGRGMLDSIKLAVEEVNARGGLQQRRVDLLDVDDQSDPAAATREGKKLAADATVLAAVGHYDRLADYAIQVPLGAGRVPDVIAGLSNREVAAAIGINEAEFSLIPLGTGQMAQAASYAWDTLGARRFAFVRDDTDDGHTAVGQFRASLQPYFKRIVTGDTLVHTRDPDFAAGIASVRKDDPQYVFFGGEPETAARFLVQLRAAGITAPFQCGSHFPSPAFIEGAGPAAEGALAVFHGLPPEDSAPGRAFLDAYAARKFVDPPSIYGIYAYAAAQALLQAASRSFLTRPSLAGALAHEQLDTALGPIRFIYGGSTYATVAMYQVQQGRWRPIFATGPDGKLAKYTRGHE